MKKRAAVLLLTALLVINSSTTAMAVGSPLFTDLTENHWACQYVSDLARQNVVKGYPDGRFRPDRSVTYGETLKLILLAAGIPEPQAQPGQHWAYPYLQYALNNSLLLSFDAGDLNKAPTRREVARLAALALNFTDISGDSPYDDCDDGYVVKLYEKDVMVGTLNEDGSRSFHPDEPISRGEISAVIWRMMNLELTEGMFRYNGRWLDVFEELPENPYEDSSLFERDERGWLTYTGGYCAHGMDISSYQGNINWKKVVEDGIDFVIVRSGGRFYGRYGTGAIFEDELFDQNMKGAIDAGLDVGAYFFSNAITVEEAIDEADALLERLEPYREHVTYPVVCDWEYTGGEGGRTYGMDGEAITACINAFCERVEEAGYLPMVYFNKSWGYTKMDLRDLAKYVFWYAWWDADYPSFLYEVQFWQYSSTGRVAGIDGNVDLDLCFVPFGKGLQSAPDDPGSETTQEPDDPVDDTVENE